MTPQELLGSVISLAVQGKLVSQLEVEGSADALYNHLVNQKLKLIKLGLAKKSKTLSQISEEEKLFEIPSSWRWIKLGEISSVITKGTTPRGGNVSYLDAGIGFLRAENVAGLDKLDKTNLKYIDENTHLDYLKRSILKAHDILITIAGTLGRTAIVREEDLPLNANQAVSMVRLVDPAAIDLTYLVYSLNSPEIQRYLTKQKKVTAIPNLTLEIIENCLVPLPPLAEQKRIVAKLEEILPLIDRYEAAWNKLEEFNKRFPVDMQKSILQMSIQGKLVPQLPKEGTGEELFQQIQTEKQALIKAGKIKKEKPLAEITEDEIPFDIPEGWKWVRLGKVVKKLTDGSHNPPPNTGKGYPVISAKNIKNGLITFENIDRYTDEAGFAKENPRTDISRGDIILGIIGGSIGNIAIYTHDAKVIAQRSIAIMATMIEAEYFVYVLKSPLVQNAMQASAAGSAQGGVYLGTLSNFLIPLPPLAEQKRIVAKLEEILPLCERLK